jgi:hypothetical protein
MVMEKVLERLFPFRRCRGQAFRNAFPEGRFGRYDPFRKRVHVGTPVPTIIKIHLEYDTVAPVVRYIYVITMPFLIRELPEVEFALSLSGLDHFRKIMLHTTSSG